MDNGFKNSNIGIELSVLPGPSPDPDAQGNLIDVSIIEETEPQHLTPIKLDIPSAKKPQDADPEASCDLTDESLAQGLTDSLENRYCCLICFVPIKLYPMVLPLTLKNSGDHKIQHSR
jgi:hypothetical protein